MVNRRFSSNISLHYCYFILLNGVRITFDKDIKYSSLLTNIYYRDFEEVMELKMTHEYPDNFVYEWLKIPDSRFSKYARSIHKFTDYI